MTPDFINNTITTAGRELTMADVKAACDKIQDKIQEKINHIHRRWIHRDQGRYPGVIWEIDAKGLCWFTQNGKRERDDASRPGDYFYKANSGWLISVDEQLRPLPEPENKRWDLDAMGYLVDQRTFPGGAIIRQQNDDRPATTEDAW